MATLSSSIVRHHVASMREVEEALARQVIYGGDLVTNLLELAPVAEAELTLLLAESHGLPPAPPGELPIAPDAVLRLVPGELALRHAFYPLHEGEGTLAIAVSEPLPPEVEGDLGFSLGARIVQQVAPLVRIRQAIARDYGHPLDRRLLRLCAKLEGRPDPSPSSIPAPQREGVFPMLPRPASVPPIGYPPVATLRSNDTGPPGRGDPTPASTMSKAFAATAERFPPPSAVEPSAPPSQTGERVVTLIARQSPSERARMQAETAPRWLRQLEPRERGRKRHRGPYTAAAAEQDLLEAESRDDVVQAFFDFFSQYFEYSALFAIQGDIAEGRDSHGPGASPEQIRAVGIPLDLPSALSAVKVARTFRLSPLRGEGIDASLAKDLKRRTGRIALVLPVVVRGRCVVLLYGDHGDSDVLLEEVGDVIAFAPLAAAALERVIVKKKLAARRALAADLGSMTPLPPSEIQRRRRYRLPNVDQRVQALARAFDSTQRPSRPPPSVPPSSAPSVSPSTIDDTPEAKRLSRTPVTALESPKAKTGPSTADESPQAKGRSPASLSPVPSQPATQAASPRAFVRSTSPSTALESPAAKRKEDAATTKAPSTPNESPAAKKTRSEAPVARVVSVGKRNTPPQGTPRVLEPHVRNEDQPFPLTRRPPSTQPAATVAPSTPSPESIDAAWDVASDARSSHPRRGANPFLPDREQRSDVGHEAPLAPASRQLSLGPRAPFPRQDAKDRLLPSVIVDIESDCKALVSRLLTGDETAIEKLVGIGDPAVSVLVAHFPGPIHADIGRRFAEAGSRASSSGPVLGTIARIGAVAIPFLVVRTADRDPVVRRWATWLLGELPSSESARAIARRFSDADPEVRRAALAAGRMLQSDVEARTTLRDGLATLAAEASQPPDVRHGSIEALAALRDPRAVPRMIPLLGASNAAIARSAHWALVTITSQDFGYDAAAWNQWWQKHRDRHRIEWLIDALNHDHVEIRRAAGEELKTLTREHFGFYEELPASERERAQRSYREWWQRRGRGEFA